MMHFSKLKQIQKTFKTLLLNDFNHYFCFRYSNEFLLMRCFSSDASQVQKSPLSGIRVLDMTRILAGPFCTMILGDLGAEIIKIESPKGGDETRNWGPPFVGNESAYFLSVNRNKKSIAIDFKKPDGCNIIKELAKKCDILVENYVPGKLASLGLDYETLQTIAPKLIYCTISGYGSTGPYSVRPGFDVIAASVSGLLSITGTEDGHPCKVGVAMTDLATGLYAHGAILTALLQRASTGIGQKIDCNLLSTQVSLLVNIASNYLNAGKVGQRWGTAHESIVPYQSFRTKDGYVTLGAGSDNHFKILCEHLNIPHIATDDRFKTNHMRVKNRKILVATLTDIFIMKPTVHWMNLLENSGIPIGPVNDLHDVFNDSQVIHNNMIIEMLHPSAGKIRMTGPAVSYSGCENKARMPPPQFSEHTDDVLSQILGYSPTEIQSLRKSKIII